MLFVEHIENCCFRRGKWREDVPYGLVIWSSLGKALNIPTPTIDAIIHIASTLLDRDFYKEGITMDKLGLPEGSKKELLEILL